MRSSAQRRVAFAGDFMTDGQLASLHLADFGGTFISESGNRGDKGVMASYAFIPEVAEEEARLVQNDRLRRFVPLSEVKERPATETDFVLEEDGDISFQAVDPLVGPKYIKLKGTVDEALVTLFRKSPLFVIETYKRASQTRKLDILNRLPAIVANLVKEGVYTTQLFQQTSAQGGRGFSCYRTLKGFASTERSVFGDNSGIACRILEILQAGNQAVA